MQWCKAEFLASLFQTSVSYADLLLKKHLLALWILKTVVLLHICVNWANIFWELIFLKEFFNK